MAAKNAFIDPISSTLKCHGYVESNDDGDIKIPVADDFNLEPGKWKYQNSEWIPVA